MNESTAKEEQQIRKREKKRTENIKQQTATYTHTHSLTHTRTQHDNNNNSDGHTFHWIYSRSHERFILLNISMEQHTNTRRAEHCATHQHMQTVAAHDIRPFLSICLETVKWTWDRKKNEQRPGIEREREPLTHVQQFLCLAVVVVVVVFLLLFLCFSVICIRTRTPLTNALGLALLHTHAFFLFSLLLALAFTVPRALCTVYRCDHHQHTHMSMYACVLYEILCKIQYFFSTWFVIALNLFKVSVQLATYELVYTHVRTLPTLYLCFIIF